MRKRLYTLVASLLGMSAAHAVTPKIPAYADIMAYYRDKPDEARKYYDGKQLFFQGFLVRTTDRTAEYFRVTDPDDVEFGAHFGAAALEALKAKFPGGEIKRGVRSTLVTFECRNEGLEKTGEPALILTDCTVGR